MTSQDLLRTALVGAGATLMTDAWLALLGRLGVPTLDVALIGRWVAHVARGRWRHAAIRQASPVAGERALGWLAHYAVGIGFAALLVGVAGPAWLHRPTWVPAVAVGVCTVAAPLFVMQPAMGLGFAASRTPTPWANRLRSLATHTVFGWGLYLWAAAIARVAR
jgi:hypothetical protein